MSSVDLSIVICTFHREQLLAKALRSLFAQDQPARVAVEILVIDNSDDGSARDLVATLQETSPFAMRWIEAHPANISVARNAGVAAATGDFVAFLDDDQETLPGWLAAMARAMRMPDVAVHFGKVLGEFETLDGVTPAIRRLFTRAPNLPAGTELYAMGPQKTPDMALATNNSMFKRSAMLIGPGPFDPAFGAGGGEDYDLICRMQQRGSRFAWLPEAVVTERVPASRCTASYMRRRAYAGGQAYAAAIAKASSTPRRTRRLIRLKALAQAAAMLPLFAIRAVQGRNACLDHSFAFAGVLGKLSFGSIHPLYQVIDAAERSGHH